VVKAAELVENVIHTTQKQFGEEKKMTFHSFLKYPQGYLYATWLELKLFIACRYTRKLLCIL
jgi:hypothetical protein